jgi:YggT family protein
MRALLDVVMMALDFYLWVIIASAVLSWLLSFNVINYHNELVKSLWNGLNALTEPVLRPIRRIVPPLNGLDIAPLILWLVIAFVQRFVLYYVYPAVMNL